MIHLLAYLSQQCVAPQFAIINKSILFTTKYTITVSLTSKLQIKVT